LSVPPETRTETLDSIGLLALVLRYQGKYGQAEQMNRRALAGSEKELGPNHPNIEPAATAQFAVLPGGLPHRKVVRLTPVGKDTQP